MDLFSMLTSELGLVLFTVISVALLLYLGYSMIHPERF
ncbi:MAG: potassium-transporting ATPase subunit F [Thermoplasmata archaeon]|nr:potassium-transporting ATPase subunit F [Thermoplasmata archaeon]